MSPHPPLVPGYDVGGEALRTPAHVVYRGRRTPDPLRVLLEVPLHLPPRPGDVSALEREHDLLAALAGIPGVPRPLPVVAADGMAALPLEDRGLAPLVDRLRPVGEGPALDLGEALGIAAGIARILAELHARDVVHGAVTPRAVWLGQEPAAVHLLDFGAAFRPAEPRGTGPALDPVYIAPEQTGRTDRPVDARADLYGLGVTLYELLTGAPPFRSADPLELMHAHLARMPVAPAALRAAIPEPVSRLVLRLLAKAPEDRYQSAFGLARDLEVCVAALGAGRPIALDVLATDDVPDRFLASRRLYGRDREAAEVGRAVADARAGGRLLLLVSGYSGIGKTSLIQELCRPLVREHGTFVTGKFDQVVRDIPYGAALQAFRALAATMLTEPEERLAPRRARLLAALGGNGGVLTAVVPEMGFVLGDQPAPPALDPVEAQNRFRYVIERFVAAVAEPDRPLVLFLDDLQWADAATLELLRGLTTAPAITHLLVIGAYRATDVHPTHPLALMAERAEALGADVRRLALGPFTLGDLRGFLADTLRADAAGVEPLARLVLQKTAGNPFFVIQFLETLRQDGLFAFDRAAGRWTFRLDAIAGASLTDNVIDLVARKIQRLSPPAQDVLTLAAAIGSRFDWDTLLAVSRQPAGVLASGLAEIVAAGLVQAAVPFEAAGEDAPASYTFLHDRVQQAAYDRLAADGRGPLHLDIGRLLRSRPGAAAGERLFELVNHLNLGAALITDPGERLALARLNLSAARQARISAAYQATATYLATGVACLEPRHWATDYELAFALHQDQAEAAYLLGRFGEAEASFEALQRRAATPRDQASVRSLEVVCYENQSRYGEAVASGRLGLAALGVMLPSGPAPTDVALDAELLRIQSAIAGRTIASLVDLPTMRDADVAAAMRLLTLMWAPAYIDGDERLARLISATMVRLSLEHGNIEDSAYGYVTHAITIGPILRDYASAYAWGELALAVNARFDDARRRAKIHQQFHAHVALWCRPFALCVPHAREARRAGLESGDFVYAGYGAMTESWPDWLIAPDLEGFVRAHAPTIELLARIQMAHFRGALQVILNWARALQGRTAGPLSLTNEDLDEAAFLDTHRASPFFLTFAYTARVHLAVVFEAVDAGVAAARDVWSTTIPGTIWPVLGELWGGLALAAAWDRLPDAERDAARRRVEAARDVLAPLAVACAENHRCGWLALRGECRRLAGDADGALADYVESLAYARETANVQQEALAAELAARGWLRRADRDAAAPYLRDAHRAYAAWGATAKVAQLEDRHGWLWPPADREARGLAAAPVETVPPADVASVDMQTVVKVARTLAVAIELDDLLRDLMRLSLENAGAERGVLLLMPDGVLRVEAVATADGAVAVGPSAAERGASWDSVPLAASVIRYVQRTGVDVVVPDAAADLRFAGDPHIARSGVRSILCVPVAHQGRPVGLLYLEHTLAANAFTPARAELMRILAGQAAIALDNARLYAAMKTEVARRAEAETALRAAVAELETLKDRLEVENVYLQEEIRTEHHFDEIVGRSPALLDMLHRVERVAPTESTVLIVGETGTGKELVARAVHSRSGRRTRPFVKVNCGAIAPGLVESELFGHVKGAFTGAVDRRVGRFEVADGGTLLLDEIGELPLDAQVKLLRVLQEQEFEPVGSSRTVRVDVRVVAATNRDLDQAVREGRFRADLLYRLNVVPIAVPPLRDREGDVRLLVAFFASRLARKLGKPIQGVSTHGMARLAAYGWPGNIRELQNVIERAAILATGPVLDVDVGPPGGWPAGAAAPGSDDTLDDVQRARILRVLDTTGGVVEGEKGAATILGLHPNTLRSRMKKLGIARRARA
jgi:transcriptional regulator with GAF, ATPase, and Fis domain/predicted ATPase